MNHVKILIFLITIIINSCTNAATTYITVIGGGTKILNQANTQKISLDIA